MSRARMESTAWRSFENPDTGLHYRVRVSGCDLEEEFGAEPPYSRSKKHVFRAPHKAHDAMLTRIQRKLSAGYREVISPSLG